MRHTKLILLTLLTLLSTLPAIAQDFEYEGIKYTVIDPIALTCKTMNGFPSESFNNVSGDVVIPPTVTYDNNIYSVIEIGEYSFIRCEELTSITLPDTLKTIGFEAFMDCSNLTSISLPKQVDSIASYAFSGCSSLTSIDLPNGITEINGLFSGCSALSSISIPETVTLIRTSSFGGCECLTSIMLPESLTQIGDKVFYNCKSLTSVIIPENVKSIGQEAFKYCNSLTSINIPEGVTTIEFGTFDGCANLTSINIPDGVTSILGSSFSGCSGLASITIPAGIESFGYYAFGSCSDLTNIVYLASTPITTHETVFSGLYDTVILEMPNANLADIQTTIPWKAFKHIIASDGSVGMDPPGEDFEYEGIIYTVINEEAKICRTKEGCFDNDFIPGNNISTDVNIPEKAIFNGNEYSVVEIGDYGFVYGKMNAFSIPNTVTKIGKYAFSNCKNLTNLKLSESLEYIGEQAFQSCQGLTSIILPESVKTIEAVAFNNCNHLESVELPASITFFGNDTFFSCTSITSVKYTASKPVAGNEYMFSAYNKATLFMPNAKLEDIEATIPWCKFKRIFASDGSIVEDLVEGDDFQYEGFWYTVTDAVSKKCMTKAGRQIGIGEPGNKVEGDIIIPYFVSDGKYDYTVTTIGDLGFCTTDITSISLPESVTLIGERAFLNCSKLNTISLGDSTKIIGQYAFSNCSDLKAIILPESLTFLGYGAFTLCTSLTSVSVPESITELKPYVFSHCEKLVSVSLPQSLTIIGGYSFEYCSNLESIDIPSNVGLIGSYAFQGCNKITSITLPSTLYMIENAAFIGCNRLESVEYLASEPISAPSAVFHETAYANATLSTPNATLAEVQATTPWNLFKRILASNGSAAPVLSEGDDFLYNGIWYTVINSDNLTVTTKEGDYNDGEPISGNWVSGDITIPSIASDGANDYTVIQIGRYSFCNNTELTAISIPESVTSIETDAFNNCSSLTKAQFESLEALSKIQFRSSSSNPLYLAHHLYFEDEEVTEVVIPESISAIKAFTFTGGSNLNSVTLHDKLTSIGVATFDGCSKLTSMTLPESLFSVGSVAFSNCTSLASINLPEKLTYIGELAFMNCNSLTSITIPADVIAIGTSAFAYCNSLSDITYNASTPIAGNANIFFSYNDEIYNTAILNMPNAVLSDIRNTTPWHLFHHIVASDGSIGYGLAEGENFEFNGIVYTVTNAEYHLVKTADGTSAGSGINIVSDNIVIPSSIEMDGIAYTVTGIGAYSFSGSFYLTSITLPASIENIGEDAFSDCARLSSLIWQGNKPLQAGVIESIGNSNLLLYVDNAEFAPTGLDHNIVVLNTEDGMPRCENMILQQGYAFYPAIDFTSLNSSLTQDFTQPTITDVCAGWETIVLPFDALSIFNDKCGELTPFASLTDIYAQYPFWLYEADSQGEWKKATAIKAGIPYIISMPNNTDYLERYNIDGPVRFSCSSPTYITGEISSPYAVTWATGQNFSSLWLPLDISQASNAMGLNVGIYDINDSDGNILPPGSAFHIGVTPRPLEAYVTPQGASQLKRIMGLQTEIKTLDDWNGLEINAYEGKIAIRSDLDRKIDIFSMDGTHIQSILIRAGNPETICNLTRGLYLVAGRKVLVK